MIQIINEREGKEPFGHRGYASPEERAEDIKRLMERGINWFVMYHDTQSRWALQYAIAGWVTRDSMLREATVSNIYDRAQRDQFQGPYRKACQSSYIYR